MNLKLDYEQSFFPLRGSRGKRTSEQVCKSPVALKRDARVEPASVVSRKDYTSGRRFHVYMYK